MRTAFQRLIRRFQKPQPPTDTADMGKQNTKLDLQEIASKELRGLAEKIRGFKTEADEYAAATTEIFNYRQHLDRRATALDNQLREAPSMEKLHELLKVRTEIAAFSPATRLYSMDEYCTEILPRRHSDFKKVIVDFLNSVCAVVHPALCASVDADTAAAAEHGVEKIHSARTRSCESVMQTASKASFAAAIFLADEILDGAQPEGVLPRVFR